MLYLLLGQLSSPSLRTSFINGPLVHEHSQVTRPEDIQNSLERRGLVSRLDQVRLTLQMFVDQAWTWYWSKYGVTHDIPADK